MRDEETKEERMPETDRQRDEGKEQGKWKERERGKTDRDRATESHKEAVSPEVT